MKPGTHITIQSDDGTTCTLRISIGDKQKLVVTDCTFQQIADVLHDVSLRNLNRSAARAVARALELPRR